MHRQRLTHRCVGNAGSSLAVIWFQLGSNEGPKNRRFVGISGADSTVLKFVNSRGGEKSKCPIWCRLQEIGSHFPHSSCTQSCTQTSDLRSLCRWHSAVTIVGNGFGHHLVSRILSPPRTAMHGARWTNQ